MIKTISLSGLGGELVGVEVDISPGFPAINIVGLAGRSVLEAKHRVIAALKSCGITLPSQKITINLTPGNVNKQGSYFDLPIAAAIIHKMGEGSAIDKNAVYWGELSLSGKTIPVNGVFAAISEAKRLGFRKIICSGILADTAIIPAGIEVINLEDTVQLLNRGAGIKQVTNNLTVGKKEQFFDPLAKINVEPVVKRILLISALGKHSLLFCGPPGAGKTMLANQLAGYLPMLSESEAFSLLKLYNLKGLSREKSLFMPPFRNPHHAATTAGILGGGVNPVPGEISLAHKGVLFLDEINHFKSVVLEALREPLSNKSITVTRHYRSIVYPADFLLVGAMNPCKCGYHLSSVKKCDCSENEIKDYRRRLSGPLRDRFQLSLFLERTSSKQLARRILQRPQENNMKKLLKAREFKKNRMDANGYSAKGDASIYGLIKKNNFHVAAEKLLLEQSDRLTLSARQLKYAIAVARTAADLDTEERVEEHHVYESLGYRNQVD